MNAGSGATELVVLSTARPPREELVFEICPRCSRRSHQHHRAVCSHAAPPAPRLPAPPMTAARVGEIARDAAAGILAPPPRILRLQHGGTQGWPARGVKLPRCERCGRAITSTRRPHACKPMSRRRRRGDASGDDAQAVAAVVPGSLALPASGVLVAGARVVNPANAGFENWRRRHDRTRAQRAATAAALLAYMRPAGPPFVVVLTWIHSRVADDDGVASACKHFRDEVARWLGISDGNRAAARWEYGQELSNEQHDVRGVDGKWRRQYVSQLRIQVLTGMVQGNGADVTRSVRAGRVSD